MAQLLGPGNDLALIPDQQSGALRQQKVAPECDPSVAGGLVAELATGRLSSGEGAGAKAPPVYLLAGATSALTAGQKDFMSRAPYIALYASDFLADVGHLGNTELGIYWRLLLVYYRDGRPLPFDTDRLRRLAMAYSPEEFRAVDAVVSEFFSLSSEPDGTRVWRHRRADQELARASHAHERKSAAAKATNQKRWGRGSLSEPLGESLSDVAKRPVSDGEPEPEPEPESQKKKRPGVPEKDYAHGSAGAPKKAAPADLGLLLEAGVERQVALDWLKIRRAKRLPLTGTAWAAIEKEAASAGLSSADAVRRAVEEGWAGFKASWRSGSAKVGQAQPSKQEALEARNAEVARRFLENMGSGHGE